MIERDYEAGEMTLACDGCGELLEDGQPIEGGVPSLQALVTSAKKDGWQVRRRRGFWEHHCRDCTPDRVAEQRALLNRR